MLLLSNDKKQLLNFLFKFSIFTATFVSLPLNWLNKFFLNYVTDFSYLKVFSVTFLIFFIIYGFNQNLTKKTLSIFLNPIYEIFLKLAGILPFHSKFLVTVFILYLIMVEPSFFKDYCTLSLKISILLFSLFRIIFFMFLAYKFFFSSIFLKEFSKTSMGNFYFQQQKNFGTEAFQKIPPEKVVTAVSVGAAVIATQGQCQTVGSRVIERGVDNGQKRTMTAREQAQKYDEKLEALKQNPPERPAVVNAIEEQRYLEKLEEHACNMRHSESMRDKWYDQRDNSIAYCDGVAEKNPTLVGAREILKGYGFPVENDVDEFHQKLLKREDELLDGDSSNSVISSIIESTLWFF